MPRTEKALDPLSGPLAAFAYDLRILREKAGHPPYRALARRAGYSASTLSVAASGSMLPSLDVTLAYVQACGGDPEAWSERWHALVAQTARDESADVPDHGENHSENHSESRCAPPLPPEHDDQQIFAHQVFDVPGPEPIGYPVKRAKRAGRRLFVMLATAAVTLVAFVLATGATGFDAASPAAGLTGLAAGQLQIGSLYDVISHGAGVKADNDIPADLRTRKDWTSEQSFLITAASIRFHQAEQVSTLNVAQIPDGTLMAQSLHDYWSNRDMADMFYAVYAGGQADYASDSSMITAFDEAQAYDDAAQASETVAVDIWNSHAQALGQQRISLHML
jgi:hypothetical protein